MTRIVGEEIRNIGSINKFKSSVFSFIRLRKNSGFANHDVGNDGKLGTRLRLNFRYLTKHTFRNNFNAMIDPTCSCVVEPETTLGYLTLYFTYRLQLLNDIMIYIYISYIYICMIYIYMIYIYVYKYIP